MTAHNDFDRHLNDFLGDGPDELPYESFDAVRDRTESTRQRVVIGPWRLPQMYKLFTIGLAAAAVVVIGVFADIRLFGEPTRSVASGVPEGPYVLSESAEGGVSITVTIDGQGWNAAGCSSDPATWSGEDRPLPATLQGPGPACVGAPDGAGLIAFQSREYRVYGDACHYEPPPPPHPNTIASTVDELTDALAGQVHRRILASTEEITVDGYPGKKVVLQLVNDAIFDGNDCEDDKYVLFGLPGDPLARYSEGPRQIEELWIVDVDGLIVVLDGLYYPDTPQSVVNELREMLASTTFGLP